MEKGLNAVTLQDLLSELDARIGKGEITAESVIERVASHSSARTPARKLPLVALLPTHPEFDDEEAAAAACGLPVLRFKFEHEEPELVWPEGCEVPVPCRALHRGFMLSHERYTTLWLCLRELDVHLITPPEACERCHYYPLAYARALSPISPRACWTPVSQPKTVQEVHFASMVQRVREWGCSAVMMKDYVKSAKAQAQRFMCIADMDELADLACQLVEVRGARFNRGVVVKEHRQLTYYPINGELMTNEFRLFFGNGQLLEPPLPNSNQGLQTEQPPAEMVAAATQAAIALQSPYVSIDLAEGVDGWFCLESGDGGFSGPASTQCLHSHWAALQRCFS